MLLLVTASWVFTRGFKGSHVSVTLRGHADLISEMTRPEGLLQNGPAPAAQAQERWRMAR